MCFYYGYLNFILGMKLPKYNLCYNTRDLIKSLAANTNDRNENILYLTDDLVDCKARFPGQFQKICLNVLSC